MEQNIDVLEDILEEVNDLASISGEETDYTQNIEVLKDILAAVRTIANRNLVQYVKSASVNTDRNIMLDMTGYEYAATDIVNVFINGGIGLKDTDWSLDTTGESVAVTIAGAESADVIITVLKMEV